MAFIIADFLNVSDFDDKNLKMCCPFHEEKTPSFIWNNKSLSFHCFGSCSKSFDIIDVFMSRGMTYIEAVQKLFELAEIPYAFGEHKVKTKHSYRYPTPEQCEDKSTVYKYLNSRGISCKTADYLDIRQDKNGNCVFNYYDSNDTLTMVKYRLSRKPVNKEPKCWCQKGADTTPLLFNMNRINTTQPLLITSGELDCAAAIESGWLNVVSIPLGDGNVHWCQECFDWLEQFEEIIICPDNDESGHKFGKTVSSMLGSWRCKIASVPEWYHNEEEKTKRHIKDLNECLYFLGKDAVIDCINNANETPIPSLIDFSNIQEQDISEMDGVKTGFGEIDSALHKLFYGSLTIVSGIPGSGKTSFLLELIANAMEQDVNCWLFSRELPNWMSKSWLQHIFAGRRNHEAYSKTDGEKYYVVSKHVKSLIDEHYRERILMYRDDFPNDADSLKESMESAVRKRNTRLFIIDNLMTVDLGGKEEDKYELQTGFINWLVQFSVKFQAAVILCCHPNKTQDYTENVGMYQIAGSSNLINLAHRALGLRRITKREKEGYTEGRTEHPPKDWDVTINVIKDRFGGKTNCEFNMYYDEVDRRFYSNDEEFDKNYGWDKKNYTDKLMSGRIKNYEEVLGSVRSE